MNFDIPKSVSAIFTVLLSFFCFIGCSDDDSEISKSDIEGTWYGIRSYYNPVGGTKYQYLTVDFYSDGTGELKYESPVPVALAYFEYHISDGNIICKGGYASSSGSVDEKFAMKFIIEGDRLIPSGKYEQFIMTRDGNVITDGDGNEVVDQSEILQGIWINDDGYTIINIAEYEIEEYMLSSQFAKTYKSKSTLDYTYDPLLKKLYIWTQAFSIKRLDETSLVLNNVSNNSILSYKRGNYTDLPTQITYTLSEMLTNASYWETKHGSYRFNFSKEGQVWYFEFINIGKYNEMHLTAQGTYSVRGTTVTCDFEEVYWDGGYLDKYKNLFPGWTYGQSCVKEYIFEKNGDNMTVTMPNGNKYDFFKH